MSPSAVRSPNRQHANFYRRVYAVVRAVPAGFVASYGDVATWLGAPRAARAVGYALACDAAGQTPWHRIVNCRGAISEGGALHRPAAQRARLEAEGLRFDAAGRLDMATVRFKPRPKQVRSWLPRAVRRKPAR